MTRRRRRALLGAALLLQGAAVLGLAVEGALTRGEAATPLVLWLVSSSLHLWFGGGLRPVHGGLEVRAPLLRARVPYSAVREVRREDGWVALRTARATFRAYAPEVDVAALEREVAAAPPTQVAPRWQPAPPDAAVLVALGLALAATAAILRGE